MNTLQDAWLLANNATFKGRLTMAIQHVAAEMLNTNSSPQAQWEASKTVRNIEGVSRALLMLFAAKYPATVTDSELKQAVRDQWPYAVMAA